MSESILEFKQYQVTTNTGTKLTTSKTYQDGRYCEVLLGSIPSVWVAFDEIGLGTTIIDMGYWVTSYDSTKLVHMWFEVSKLSSSWGFSLKFQLCNIDTSVSSEIVTVDSYSTTGISGKLLGTVGKYYNPSGYSGFLSYNDTIVSVNGRSSTGSLVSENAEISLSYPSQFIYGTIGNYWDYILGCFTEVDPKWDLGDNSDVEGGGGNFDDSSDPIPLPEVPSWNLCTSGLINMYELTIGNLIDLGDFLVSDSFLGNVKKLFTDPMEYIISLDVVPYDVNGTTASLSLGRLDSGISCKKISQQYYQLDFGNIDMDEFWGNFLDYAPNTTIQLVLPYGNPIILDTNEIMGGILNLVYNVDLFSGVGVANLMVVKDNLTSVLYSVNVNLQGNIPLSATNYSQQILGVASGAMSVVSGAIGLGFAKTAVSTATSALGTASSVGSTLNSGLNQKNIIQRNGNGTGIAGFLSPQKAYLIINRPKQSRPENYGNYKGYPLNVYTSLDTLSGFTIVEEIHIENGNILKSEEDLLIQKLKEGVIF